MTSHPLIRFVIPSLILGGVAGFLIGNTFSNVKATSDKKLSPRAAFLSSDDDAVDYEKLALVCLHAADSRGPRRANGGKVALPNAPEVEQTKSALDRVMSVSL
jgi:hypothetical protein